MNLTIQEIMDFLPHRYPFLLIDRVLEFEPAKRLVAIKNVTMNEPFFQGHFPGVSDHAGRAGGGGDGPGRRADHAGRDRRTGQEAGGVYGHREGQVPPPRHAGRPDPDRGGVLSFRRARGGWQARPTVDGKLACEATLTCTVVPREREERAHGDAPDRGWRKLRPRSQREHSSQRGDCGRSAVPASCTIGPYCTIGPEVELGEDCTLISHVVIDGRTRIGARNTFIPFARSGGAAGPEVQGRAHRNRDRRRQHDSRRRDDQPRHGRRRRRDAARSGNLLMAYAHIGHDSQVGSHCILANSATLAGHVIIEDYVTLGAFCPSPALRGGRLLVYRRRDDCDPGRAAVLADLSQAGEQGIRDQ